MYNLSEFFSVDKDESLCELAYCKNLLDEVDLFTLLAFHDILLDGLQLVHGRFWRKFNLVGLTDDLRHFLLNGLVLL